MNRDKHGWHGFLFYLCSSVFICGSILFSAHAEPKLLFDPADIDQLKQKIAGPFANQWRDFRGEVDRAMEKPIELPPRGGNWSHNYVCPEHGMRLRQGKQIGLWQWEHICPVGPHILHGDPSKGTTDFDGNAIMGIHLGYADQLVGLGVMYQVTRDAKYARRARDILIAYADKYESYPLHDNQGRLGKNGAHVASQSLTEASWLIQMTQGADLIWDTLSIEDRDLVEKRLLRPAIEECILPHNLGIHNIQCRHNSAIGLVGFLLNDKHLVDLAIDDPHSGFRTQIAKGVRDDGIWTEGSSGYHFFTIDGLIPLAEAARHAGIDLYSPRFKSMFDGPLNLAMPDMRLPNFNDSGIVELSSRADSYELAYARWKDQSYLPLIDSKKRNGRLALLYGDATLPNAGSEGTREDPDRTARTRKESRSSGVPLDTDVWSVNPSRNLTSSGFAILEEHDGSEATWLCLKYGPHGGGHGHFDKNHFVLWHDGAIVMPDAGTHAYGSPLHTTWDKTSLAHNTLTVDEDSQSAAEGKCIAFGSSNGVDFAITDAQDAYKDKNLRFVRTVAMIDPTLIVVIDRIDSDQEHTLDLAAHFTGKWTDVPAGQEWTAPKKPGYLPLRELTTRPTNDTISLRTATASLTLVGGEPTEVITGTGVGESTDDRVPLTILRRHAKSTTYIWAIGLDKDLPKVSVTSTPTATQLVIDHKALKRSLTVTRTGLAADAVKTAKP